MREEKEPTLWERFLRAFGGTDKDTALDARIRAHRVKVDTEAADEHIAALLASAESMAASALGSLQILNLSEVKARIGKTWPRVSNMVHLHIENTLSRRLKPRDAFFLCKEGIYALVFAHTSRAEAEARCQSIADEIMLHLFGSDGVEAAEKEPEKFRPIRIHAETLDKNLAAVGKVAKVREAVANLAIKAAERRRSSSNPKDALDLLLDAASATLNELLEKQPTRADFSIIAQVESLVEKLRRIEREAASKLRDMQADDAGPNGLQPTLASKAAQGEKPQDMVWRSIQVPQGLQLMRLTEFLASADERLLRLRASIPMRAPMSDAENEIAWKELAAGELSYHVDYLQVLDSQRSLSSINVARIHFKQSGQAVTIDELSMTGDEVEVRAISARLLLREAIAELANGTDTLPLICMTIDEITLTHLGSRRAYVSLVSQVPAELRRMILFELRLRQGWQSDVPSIALQELGSYCGGIYLRFPISDVMAGINLQRISSAVLREMRGIGAVAPRQPEAEPAFTRALGELVRAGQGVSQPIYLGNIPRKSMMMAALDVGVRFVSGEQISAPSVHPWKLEPKTVEDFYSPPRHIRD